MTVKVTYVWGNGCSVCNITRPAFNNLSNLHPEWEYETREASAILKQLLSMGVDKLPVFIVEKDDQIVGHFEGSYRLHEISSKIEGIIK